MTGRLIGSSEEKGKAGARMIGCATRSGVQTGNMSFIMEPELMGLLSAASIHSPESALKSRSIALTPRMATSQSMETAISSVTGTIMKKGRMMEGKEGISVLFIPTGKMGVSDGIRSAVIAQTGLLRMLIHILSHLMTRSMSTLHPELVEGLESSESVSDFSFVVRPVNLRLL